MSFYNLGINQKLKDRANLQLKKKFMILTWVVLLTDQYRTVTFFKLFVQF